MRTIWRDCRWQLLNLLLLIRIHLHPTMVYASEAGVLIIAILA